MTRRRKPGEVLWAVYRQNLDGSEPRYYLSNAPPDAALETLAYRGQWLSGQTSRVKRRRLSVR